MRREFRTVDRSDQVDEDEHAIRTVPVPAGKRFLTVEPIAFQSNPLTVLVNWRAKLKRP